MSERTSLRQAASTHVRSRRFLGLSIALALVAGIGVAATSSELGFPWRDAKAPATDISQRLVRPGVRLCGRAPARRRYVAPTGRDSNPGTLRRPWRTLERGLRAPRPGDAIYARAGTYAEWVVASRHGTKAAPTSLRSYPGEHPVITGRLKIIGEYFCVRGFRFRGNTRANGTSVLIYVSGARHVEILRNEIVKSAMSGIYVGDEGDLSKDVSIVGNYIRGNGTHPRLDHGIYFGSATTGVVANNLVVGNLAIGVKVAPEATDVVVTQNTVVRNHWAGILVGGEGGLASSGILVVNNIVAYNEWGIRTYWERRIGERNLALRNLVFGNVRGAFWFPGGGMAEQQSIVTEPAFALGGDYRLRGSSLAIDSAIPTFSMWSDVTGRRRPVGDGPDLGAFER